MYTLNSRIRDIYAHPLGHDMLDRILYAAGVPRTLLKNPIVGSMRLSWLETIASGKLDTTFFQSFIDLLNMHPEKPGRGDGPVKHAWWKEAVFYQIYPRSFCDSDGDGIGDLKGILSKLDYLKSLGVDALWLSPVYDSPNDDNGYDIRDYEKIMAEFGTMEDFEELLAGVHERGMRLIMDLVVNHTSDEHPWFQEGLHDPTSKYRGYYFFRNPDQTNNWTSFFSGPAWNTYEEQNVSALHLFSKKQMDFNWDNPDVRDDVIGMVNRWLDRGVDGFRMDVINYISKVPGLPEGSEGIAELIGFKGIEHYFYGPKLHEYLHEIHERAFAPHNAFSVGECPGVGLMTGRLVTGEERKELDMIFSFDHLDVPGHVRYDDYAFDLRYYRDYITDWMENYGNNCWMSLFYNNHDNPRMSSKVRPDGSYIRRVQKLLLVMQMTLKGTPFLFQGDEMGLANYSFTSMDEITDVEAHGYHKELLEKGKTPEEAFSIILSGTREHARVPLPWNRESMKESVLQMTPAERAEKHITAFLDQKESEEIRTACRRLIALRKEYSTLIYGDFHRLMGRGYEESGYGFAYERRSDEAVFRVECNLGEKTIPAYRSKENGRWHLVYGTLRNRKAEELGPFEARIWKKEQ